MDRSETVLLSAYALAGLIVLGCAFAPARSGLFRGWCVVLGAFVAAWPWWLLRSADEQMPLAWRVGPLAVPVLLLLVTIPGVYQRRRARLGEETLLPEIEEQPEDPDKYPADVPLGELPPPHDPWKALYASLARQRAKWEEAAGGGTPTAAGPPPPAKELVPADTAPASAQAAEPEAADREDPPNGAGPSGTSGPSAPGASEPSETSGPSGPPSGTSGPSGPRSGSRRRPRQYSGRHREPEPRVVASGTVSGLARLWRVGEA